jgi:branched-chain amino acid transport system permease protein
MAVMFIVGLILFVRYTKPGMAMRALAQDKEAACLQGVDIHKISTLGFAIGAALAGVAGGLLAPILMVYAGSGGAITLKSFIMMLIGGFGSVPGAIVGGLVLGFWEAVGYAILPGTVTYLIIFCAVMFLLILRPQGIMGRPFG